MPVSSRSVQVDRKPRILFALSRCGVKDSSRGLFSTGYHTSGAIRICPELIVGAPEWARPSAPSLEALKTACDHVSAEMDVLLSIRVFSEVQERIGVIQVAVLIVCEAKSWSGVSRMLIHP